MEQASTSSPLTPSKVNKTKQFKSPKALKTKSAKRRLMDIPGSSSAPVLDEAVNLMKSIQAKRAETKDEHSLYGEQIAIRLRRLLPQIRFHVQQSFNQILFDAEMGIFEHTAPKRPSFSNLTQSTPYSPMSFAPRPFQSPVPLGMSYQMQSPVYSSSNSTSPSPISVVSDFTDTHTEQFLQDL